MADKSYSLHISPNCSSNLSAGHLLREVVMIKMVVLLLIILLLFLMMMMMMMMIV